MRSIVLASLMVMVGCGPRPRGKPAVVQVPVADAQGGSPAAELRKIAGPRPTAQVEIPAGSTPSTLRPDPRVQVHVPHDEVLPRGVKKGAIPTR